MNGQQIFEKYGNVINFLVKMTKILPRRLRIAFFNYHRNTNGKFGMLLRYIYLKTLAKSVGNNVSILPGCYFKYPENLEIGDNVSFQPMCFISCAGGVMIGNNVSIAHHSTLLSTSHTFEHLDIPIKYQEIELKKTIISNDVWIGCGVVILGGIHISEGSIIGANSTVTHNVSKYSIVAGSPAKVIKNRKEDL